MDWHDDLEETRAEAWRLMSRGVADRKAGARHPVLATLGRDGWPEARTLVLRGADPRAGEVELWSDRLAGKVAELSAEPRASLHVWEPKPRLQIRMRLHVSLLTGEAAEPIWARVPEAGRGLYGGEPPPGAPMDGPERAETPEGRLDRFAVIRGRVAEIETLYLGPGAHRRARFRRAEDWAGVWLAP